MPTGFTPWLQIDVPAELEIGACRRGINDVSSGGTPDETCNPPRLWRAGCNPAEWRGVPVGTIASGETRGTPPMHSNQRNAPVWGCGFTPTHAYQTLLSRLNHNVRRIIKISCGSGWLHGEGFEPPTNCVKTGIWDLQSLPSHRKRLERCRRLVPRRPRRSPESHGVASAKTGWRRRVMRQLPPTIACQQHFACMPHY